MHTKELIRSLDFLDAAVFIYDKHEVLIFHNDKVLDYYPSLKPLLSSGENIKLAEIVTTFVTTNFVTHEDKHHQDDLINNILIRCRKQENYEMRELANQTLYIQNKRVDGGGMISLHTNISPTLISVNDYRSMLDDFLLITETSNIGIWKWDIEQGRVIINDAVDLILHLQQEQRSFDSSFWQEMLTEESYTKFSNSVCKACRNEMPIFECELEVKSSDKKIWILMQGQITGQDLEEHSPNHVIGIIQDISTRRQAEIAAYEAMMQANKANQIKSDFLANMSHEIRTPMNGILGLTQLCLETPLNDEQREYLSMVYSSGQALLSIINDILDISKIESGKIDLVPESFEIRKFIFEMIQPLKIRAFEKNLEFIVDIGLNVPETVYCDASRLRQVLVNLLGNSIKFTHLGDVRLIVEYQADTNSLDFRVVDTGIGVPVDKREAIFEQFSQADSSITREYGGTGLGLSISSQLVALMGGKLKLESQMGKGSTFYFSLPKVVLDGALPNFESLKHLPGFSKFLIVLIDDNETNLHLLKKFMEKAEISNISFSSPFAAFDFLSTHPASVIITDMLMPGMSGADLIQKLRHDSVNQTTPVLVLSSLNRSEVLEQLKGFDTHDILMKPIDFNVLVQRIKSKFIDLNQQQSASTARTVQTLHATTSTQQILVAEDNLINQKLILALLKKLGHQITMVGNGQEALNAVSAGTRFDLIILDIQMPVMDGMQALAQLKKMMETGNMARTPVIALTANALSGDEQKYLNMGFDGYLSKPVDIKQLTAMIEALTLPPPVTAAKTPANQLIDVHAALQLMNDDHELLVELCGIMLDQIDDFQDQISAAVSAGDLKTQNSQIHKLKGELTNFACHTVVAFLNDVEYQGSLMTKEQSQKLVDYAVTLKSELQRIK